ncbi:hypothetical protein GCM10009789_35750 [Kribbella sancticallisti]|uniref:Uncharacterized protein n=2 Tax=Kribbella sancticallisti TaxID=460087 RepID=A0ABP4PGT9_9ACTN
MQALERSSLEHDVPHVWNWWQEGRHEAEHARIWKVLAEWDHATPRPALTEDEIEQHVQAEMKRLDEHLAGVRQSKHDLAARRYDETRHRKRLEMMRAEADSAFFAHVADAPASTAQCERAEQRSADCRAVARTLRAELGDPDQVIDRWGTYPAERRVWNLDFHMRCWRYPCLREWADSDKRRFNALLKMPPPDPAEMCSECQAPTMWHEYDISLSLFQARPEADSKAETIARLLPGWWERCPACTAYQIEHRWGTANVLPDFDGEQWRAMLPPMLRAIFAPAPRRQTAQRRRPTSQPLAVIQAGPIAEVVARLAEIQQVHPTAQLRPADRGTWAVWPK